MGIFRLLLAFCVIATHTSGIVGVSMMPGEMAVQVFFMISPNVQISQRLQ